MKLNNKGMSLLELLVSIVLISIVLTFLFSLLNDLKNETNNNNFAFNNQVNRVEIIKTIEDDLTTYPLVGIKDKSIDGNIKLEFDFLVGGNIVTTELSSSIKTTQNSLGEDEKNYYLKYINYKKESSSWELKDATLDPCGMFTYYVDNLSNSYYFKIDFYLYNKIENSQNNKEKNNVVDDIEITYAGNKEDLDTNNGIYLTTNNKAYKKIGACTE